MSAAKVESPVSDLQIASLWSIVLKQNSILIAALHLKKFKNFVICNQIGKERSNGDEILRI